MSIPRLTIESVSYRQWPKAYRCTISDLELIVVVSVGPRILSLRRRRGANLLYHDVAGMKVAEWKLYGGHRFTVAPEFHTSYQPDNAPCKTRLEYGRLVCDSPADGGLRKTLSVSALVDASGFELTHTLHNEGALPWRGAAWAITCVPSRGEVVVPWGSGVPAWRTHFVRFWKTHQKKCSLPSSQQWSFGDDHIRITPNGETGKIGLHSDQPWLVLLRSDGTFAIRVPQVHPEHAYPDGGCNLEVYTAPRYLELETVGPLVTLLPGQSAHHIEEWRVDSRVIAPSDWRGIKELLGGISSKEAGKSPST